MAFVVALIIIALISFVSVRFRCYACFNLLMIGLAAFIAGNMMNESLFTVGGAVFLFGGLGIMFLTSLKVEKSRRIYYMGNLFLSGMFSFLHVMLIMMIVTISFASIMHVMAKDYREKVLVDVNGNRLGTVLVDENNVDPHGNVYNPHDPY